MVAEQAAQKNVTTVFFYYLILQEKTETKTNRFKNVLFCLFFCRILFKKNFLAVQ